MLLRHPVKSQTWIIDFEFVGNKEVKIINYELDIMGKYNPVKKDQTYGYFGCNEEGIITQLFICSGNKAEAYKVINPMKRLEYVNRRRTMVID